MMENTAKNFTYVEEKKDDWHQLLEVKKQTTKQIPQYLVIKMEENGKTFNDVSPFLIHKWISSFSKTITVRKLKKSGTLFIHCLNVNICEKLLGVKTFLNMKITVVPHRTLNQSKGVFYCNELRGLTEDEIYQELINQSVLQIKRIGSSSSSLFVATFDTPRLPERLYIGYLSVPLRVYVPPPLVCFRCGCLGHHRATCEKEPVCRKCAQPAHDNECTTTKCCLCGDGHRTTVKSCPIYAQEFEINKNMVLNKINYYEAKKLVSRVHGTHGKKGNTESYAQKAAAKPDESESIAKLTSLIELMNKRMDFIENLLVKHATKPASTSEDEAKIDSNSNENELPEPRTSRSQAVSETRRGSKESVTEGTKKENQRSHRKSSKDATNKNMTLPRLKDDEKIESDKENANKEVSDLRASTSAKPPTNRKHDLSKSKRRH